jgi:hypothetical protein
MVEVIKEENTAVLPERVDRYVIGADTVLPVRVEKRKVDTVKDDTVAVDVEIVFPTNVEIEKIGTERVDNVPLLVHNVE